MKAEYKAEYKAEFQKIFYADMDLKKMGLEKYELGRCASFQTGVKDKDIILLGTPLTAEAWSKSDFKSGDGTFKICPKQFYQD